MNASLRRTIKFWKRKTKSSNQPAHENSDEIRNEFIQIIVHLPRVTHKKLVESINFTYYMTIKIILRKYFRAND